MKILWITSVYPSDDQPGRGVFHETQVQALVRLGVEVTVICPVPRNPALIRLIRKQYQVNDNILSQYQRKGVTVYRPPYLALPGQLRWAQPSQRIAEVILSTISEYELKPDLMHAHFAMPSGGATRIVAEQKKLPWILTLHGSDVNVYPYYSASSKKAFIQSVKKADHVLAVAGNLQQKTKELTGRECSVLPIGVNLTQFQQPKLTKVEMRRQLQLPENKKLIVFVGRLTEAKGVFELAKALDDLPEEIAVVFVGDGPAKGKLNQYSDLNKRLFMIGQVENEMVKDYLFASDVFALPSYTEGMPTVVIEAIALKIPVICTEVGGVPELFGEYRDLLIAGKSVPSLVDRIQDVFYRNRYPTMVVDGLFDHIQKNYHADHNAALLNEAYKRAIKSTYLSI